MTQQLGTLVIAPIRANDSADTYPTAYASEILGGWKAAASAAARAAIPTDRLEAGGVCWQIDTGVLYRWDGAAWQVVTLGGGAATSIDLATATITNTLPSANSGALTGDVTKPAGSSTTTIPAATITNAMRANMAQSTLSGRAAGAGTGAPTDLTATQATAILNAMVGDSGSGGTAGLAPAAPAGSAAAGKYLGAGGTYSVPSVQYTSLPSLGIAISNWPIGTGVFADACHGGYYNGYLYIASKTTSRVHKIHSVTGRVTVLTPSTLTFGARTLIKWYPNLAKFICFGSNGFITLDPTTDTFGSVINPAGWGTFYGDYDDTNGFVYYPNGSRLSRCTITGATVTDGGAFSGAASCVCVAGANVFVMENNNPSASKVRKYVIASWPTLNGTSLTLGGDVGYTGGLCYNTFLSKLYVADLDGIFKVVDPTTVTVDSSVSLSGIATQQTRAIVYVATPNRAFAVDNAGKVWSIDASNSSVVLGIIPATSVGETGFTYDTDKNILAAALPGGTSLQRWYA